MVLSAQVADITTLDLDAIVNAANEQLSPKLKSVAFPTISTGMRLAYLAIALLLFGGACTASTATLPAEVEARMQREGVVRRAADLIFRYTQAPGRRSQRWEDRRASIVVTPATILIYKNAKVGLEITPRTRREVAIERDGRRIRVRAGQGRAEELWSFEPPDGDAPGWGRDLRAVLQYHPTAGSREGSATNAGP